jgi:hypothetical protein
MRSWAELENSISLRGQLSHLSSDAVDSLFDQIDRFGPRLKGFGCVSLVEFARMWLFGGGSAHGFIKPLFKVKKALL